MSIKNSPEVLRRKILELTREYTALVHGNHAPEPDETNFVAGVTPVPYAARVFDSNEVAGAVNSVLDFWLTLGNEGVAFEKELAAFLGCRHSILTNSGSSANLLATSALTSYKLPDHRRLKPGDEIITVAAGFPTTVAPILQNRAVPVFIDSDPLTLNARIDQLEAAYSPGKTRAILMAHTLGNPFQLAAVTEFCRLHDLWLIEDNCDALGSEYFLSETGSPQLTGTFGDLATQSFYPAHHMTLGEGGAVCIARNSTWKPIVESLRDWGRDCWCASGHDNSCGKRFGWQLGELPAGYDHKYIYSHLGYNLKPLDIQAAIGRHQIDKLPGFNQSRRQNWTFLRQGLNDLGEFFDFHLPTHATSWTGASNDPWNQFSWDSSGHRSNPAWFGFLLLIKPDAPFSRTDLSRELDRCKIGNRTLFGGNLVRQPAWTRLQKESPNSFRTIGPLPGADAIMARAIFVGVYPGLTRPMLEFIIETITRFAKSCRRSPLGA